MKTKSFVISIFITSILCAIVGLGYEHSHLSAQDSNLSRNERTLSDAQWSSDLDSLIQSIHRIHPNPYWKTPKEVFDHRIALVKKRIPDMSDNEIVVEFMRLLALVKDGHTQLLGTHLTPKWYPVRIESFADGWFITSVSTKYANTYSAKVLRIANTSVEAVMSKVMEVVPADNEWWGKYYEPKYLMMYSVMQSLGYVNEDGSLELQIVSKDGTPEDIKINAEPYKAETDFAEMAATWFWRQDGVPAHDYVNLINKNSNSLPLMSQNYNKSYWFTYLAEQKTIYLGFNECQEDSSEKFDMFCQRLWKQVETGDVDKLIIDLRNNMGGTSDILRPLLHGIIRHPSIDRHGHLFVMIGRKTFSAAFHCAMWIENECHPIFVGEPTGAPPNHCADPEIITLPNSGLTVMISHMYWQKGKPDDQRQYLAPQIEIARLSGDYFNCKDSALESALSFKQ